MALSFQWNRQALSRLASSFNNVVYFVCFVRVEYWRATFVSVVVNDCSWNWLWECSLDWPVWCFVCANLLWCSSESDTRSRLHLQINSNCLSIARRWEIMLFPCILLYIALFWENMIDRVWIMCQWIMNLMCQQCWCGCLSWKDVTDDWSSFINIVFNNMWITRSYEHFTLFYFLSIILSKSVLNKPV